MFDSMREPMKWSDFKAQRLQNEVFDLVREKIKVKNFSALVLGSQGAVLHTSQIKKVIKVRGTFFITMTSGEHCVASEFFTTNNRAWAENFISKSLNK